MLNTYEITCSNILVEDFYINVVAKVLDVDVKCLVPSWGLSRTLQSTGLEGLLSCLELRIRIHLREELGVSCETSFNDRNIKAS